MEESVTVCTLHMLRVCQLLPTDRRQFVFLSAVESAQCKGMWQDLPLIQSSKCEKIKRLENIDYI